MPIFSPVGNLDITNATLRTSNIETQHIQISNVSISAAHDLQQVTGIGNATTITTEFNNATTSLTTASNVTVGNELTVSGNVTSSQETTLSGNVTVGKNILLSSNTTTSVDSNVVVEHFGPHKRYPITPVLKKFPDVDFTQDKFDYNDSTLTYTQAGYVVTASSQSSGSEVWRLFDDGDWNQEAIDKYPATTFTYNPSSNPYSLGDVSGEWFKVKFPRKVIINKFTLNVGDSISNGLAAFKVLGSDDDTNWTEVKDVSGLTSASYTTAAPFVTTVESVSSEAYRYYAVVITQLLGVARVTIREVEFYGYEEDLPAGDTSLDTTFTSILNRPQTSGVKVYVDGDTLDNKVTGPTPTSTGATYDSTGKYWSITSNISVEANTFLEGDAPHSVSVWFNSSNLEANVSNTCVFSISDREKLDSQNLNLQSNTWHNLTYAYQGEGGSRVTYLDGRKMAEDQAEDTFGDYPPFAMTGYSQGGYVVSASSEHTSGNYPPWKLFDTVLTGSGVSFETNGGRYDTTGAPYEHTAGVSTTVSGIPYTGDWVQVYFPFKFKVDHIDLMPQDTYGLERMPQTAIIAGSDDNVNWTLIKSITTDDHALTKYTPYIVNATRAYKYIRFIWNTLTTAGGNAVYMGRIAGQEMRFYGHRENDLVRLPDPTRVLKYPHIAMTTETTTVQGPQINPGMPGDRGYEIIYSNHGGSPQLPSRAFDGKKNSTTNPNDAWMTGANAYNTGDGALASGQTHALTIDGTSRGGSWVGMKMPRKLKLDSVVYYPRHGNGWEIYNGYVVGSNNGTSWDSLLTISAQTGWAANTPKTFTMTNNLNTYYQYFAILATHVQANNTQGRFAIQELEFYGTEEATSVPIQIGGGNIDKVANFRVYDKFVGEDQALEIWDAQKDTFRGVKNSMTLHKGYLGLGTEEPEGRLAILDEPHNLEEFPPRAMSDYKTYFEGHGVFKVSASSEQNTTTTLGWHVFAKIRDDINKRWRSDSNLYDNTVSPATTTSANATFDGIGVRGEWILLEMPYNICLKKYEFIGFTSQTPHTGQIWGSDDSGTTWHHVDTFQNAVGSVGYPTPTNTFHVLGNTKYYSKYVFIVEKLTSADDAASMSSLKYFGTREQRQSVLHDGQLTLTKNLDVPRIGPPLDADDTPRRDRLVVEYNTSSNPTFEGAVRDTSGRGLDGIMHTATYDSTGKAIESNGNSGTYNSGPAGTTSTASYNDYGSFETVLPPLQGNPIYTVSGWFKQNTIANLQIPWLIGKNVRVTESPGSGQNSKMSWFGVESNGRPKIAIGGGGNLELLYTSGSIKPGKWHHMVIAVQPSGTSTVVGDVKFYLDGVSQSTSSTSGSSGDIDLGDGAPPRMHWFWQESSTVYYDGSASNIKLYDTALTAQEVKTLYDMGRNGSVANPQPLHIATQLDVRGLIKGMNATTSIAAWSVAKSTHIANVDAATTIEWDDVQYNIGGCYSNPNFTAPVSGYYYHSFHIITRNDSNSTYVGYYINDTDVDTDADFGAYDSGSTGHRNIAGSWILYLNAGDRLKLVLKDGSMNSNLNRWSGFFLSS
jgi:hypothetical protein